MNKYVVSLYKHSLDRINIRRKKAQQRREWMLESTNIEWSLEETNASDEAGSVWSMANICLILNVVAGNKFSTKSYNCV